MLQQPPLGSPSGADAADPLHEESVSQAKTVYSDSDSGEDVSAEFPVGLLHARQAGLFQDAKPQQRLSPGVPPRPAHPTALLHAPRASQGGLDSSSDHSSRNPPISDGTRAWVADSFVEGQPLSDRRKVARRRALTMDLTGVPSASPPRRGAPPSSPQIAATCPRACSTSATTRTTKSEPLPRPSRCAEGVCLCLHGCRSECEILAKVFARRAGMHICICVHEQCS